METAPLIVIVGETASGKTALALELAERLDGEIICADSRTVYTGMDIGTAKPTEEEQARVPHHLLDVVRPDEHFTAADFKRLANQAIIDISSRGKLPIMVGGTGLYVDSLLFDYSFADKSVERDPQNPHHVAREAAGSKGEMRENTLVFGLRPDREELRGRISSRVDAMVADGLVEETKWLMDNYPTSKALDSTGYKAFRGYIQGSLTLDEAKALFIRNDIQLAKRQRTWFKRNNSIHWLDNSGDIVDIATTFLNKKAE